jgi:hypothetical protein
MSVLALIVAVLAVGIAAWVLYYTREADRARWRAERAAPLHRIETLIHDVAITQAATDPQAVIRLRAELAALQQAVAVIDADLRDCSAYASHADPALRPAAEQELARDVAGESAVDDDDPVVVDEGRAQVVEPSRRWGTGSRPAARLSPPLLCRGWRSGTRVPLLS